MEAPTDVGELLKSARMRHRLTQTELAVRAGTTQAGISRLERGLHSPSFSRVDALLRAMGESVRITSEPMSGGNESSGRLRDDYRGLSPGQRIAQGAALSQLGTGMAVVASD